jgi:branched-chain amino acid transport system permease protein
MLAYSLLAGLIFGLYFSLVGMGLNLIFGVMKMVNLAHGDVLMLGAFAAFWLYRLTGLHPAFAVPLLFALWLAIGIPFYYLVVPRLQRARDPEMLSIIFFFGLSQLIVALATIAFGTNERSIPGRVMGRGPVQLLGQSFPSAWMVSGAVSAALVALVSLYLYRTRLGTRTRAVMVSRDEALVSGIDVHRVSAIALAIGLGLAAAAGVFAPFMLGSVRPGMGGEINIVSFVVIVIGSLGNPLGTLLGGILYGVALMFMQSYFSSWANLLPYLLLIAVLLLRPSGLLGRKVRNA